jgi:tripartite ATP-independent transporter DctM subunit
VSIELLTIILFASMFLILATGIPIAFGIGAVAAGFALILWGPDRLAILAAAGFSSIRNVNLAAIPLFIFLGLLLKSSGVGDQLFEAVHVWLGRIPGGLAIGCLLISILLGAICGGLVGVMFMLANIALPAMLKRGYDKYLAVGCVTVGGLLGLIIPPSVEIIVYSTVTGESVGKMYLGCLVPGLVMGVLYMLYIAIRCRLNPKLGPPLPPEVKTDWKIRIVALKSVTLPLILILCVVVGIYGGIMSPLEASAFGAFGALVVVAIGRRLTWEVLKESVYGTAYFSGFLAWILIGIACFTSVYQGIGAPKLALKLAHAMPGGGWAMIALMQAALLGFGTVMDDWAMILIFGPIFAYVVKALGFSTLWYGVVFLINIQVAFLSPPFGFALFIMRAAVPTELNISLVDIYRSVLPFIGLAILALILTIIFPPLATYLPHLVIGD